jgi:2-iminobutanoate/2-iminopropanoate deaminase
MAQAMTKSRPFHLRPEGENAFGYAQAVRHGDTLYVAGTLSLDDGFAPLHAGDMAAQIEAVYAAIRATLAAHGATLLDVVRETIYVTDMDAFVAANGARMAAYAGWHPAATAVEVGRLAFPECMVEIEVTAIL